MCDLPLLLLILFFFGAIDIITDVFLLINALRVAKIKLFIVINVSKQKSEIYQVKA